MKNYGFNLKHNDLLNQLDSNVKFELNLYKNKVLLTGDAATVERFYKEDIGKFSSLDKYEKLVYDSSFWQNVEWHNARVFFGITKMINDAFVRLVTNGGFDVRVNNNDQDTERLEKILTFNQFKDALWGKGESFQSGLGYFAYKIDIDTEIANVPIVELIDPSQIETITKRGFVVGFKFKKRYQINDTDYEVHEVYRKENGSPLLEYLVWRDNANNGEYVPFEKLTMEECAELGLLDDKGKKINPINTTFENLSDIPVILKNNTAYNTFFTQSPYGEADTQGIDTIEDALSETLSSMIEEIRKGRIKHFISEELLETGADGTKKGFSEFKTAYELVSGATEQEGGKSYITTEQGKINSEKYLAGARELIANAINKANLHPITVGVTGLESIVASSESQQEREKTSLRTREMKLKSWRKSLVKLFKLLLETQDIIENKKPQEYNITIDFGEFTNPNPESVINLLGKSIQEGLMSTQQAIKKYHGEDLSDEEILLESIAARLEGNKQITASELRWYDRKIAEINNIEYNASPMASPNPIIEEE